MSKDILFVYVLPPLVGAVIGLFTNWLAIKMLFRPMKEVRILGIRIPFTPGILPRERFRLAESIGDTVAGDLLTEEVLVDRIKSEEFRQGLKLALIEGGKSLSAVSLGDIGNSIRPELSLLVSRFFSQSLESITKSEAFNFAAQAALKAALVELYNIRLDDIFGESFWKAVSQKFSDDAEREKFSVSVSGFFIGQLFKAVDDGKKPADFIKAPDTLKFFDRIFDLVWPLAISKSISMLGQKNIRSSLEKAGAVVIRKTMERMNSVQRFFIGIGGYEKTIIENMPFTIADSVDALQKYFLNPGTAAVMRQYMRDSVLAAMDKPLRDNASLSSPQERLKVCRQCSASLDSILAALSSDRLQAAIRIAMADSEAGDVLSVFPGLSDSLVSSAVGFISGMCRSGDESSKAAGRILSLFLVTFSEYAAKASIGSIMGLEESRIEEISVVLATSLSDIAASQSARILKSVDVRNLVRDRINELDVGAIEEIILRVMDKELKAVTWFGALLGGLMGLGQTIIALIRF